MRPLKAYIDLSALTFNLKLVKKIAKNSKVMAVLKANAYGHGLIESVKAIKGAEGIAILTIEEAVKIRKAGFKNTILLLEGLFAAEDIHQAEKLLGPGPGMYHKTGTWTKPIVGFSKMNRTTVISEDAKKARRNPGPGKYLSIKS